ncbi:ATP-binding cassette domain-containing protein [candidate division WWE3 bacterium]|uniref:ATP-binding cassette domain-containing protein n=1 Tax=candidate division WWE3 bacterium TaxID=2053526 RepID=A0A7X9HH63_UNCKA|nr:ATP-binding cassette domain-containing protein [candidate division WWE3 bacterium]
MINIRNFSYSYPENRSALKEVDLSISSGEFVLLAGPNGGGKSTLLQAILGVVPEYYGGELSGTITFEGKNIGEFGVVKLAGKVGIVLQDPESQISNLTVWEEVTFALGNLLLPKDEVIARGIEALATMGIASLKDYTVETLSGGQLQRLAIATLLAIRPKVLILDEPLANLDPLGVNSVVEAVKILKEHVDVVIVASHWLDPFLDISTRLIVIDSGRIALDIPSNSIGSYLDELRSLSVEIPQKILVRKMLSEQGIAFQSSDEPLRLPFGATLRMLSPLTAFQGRIGLQLRDVGYSYDGNLNRLEDVTFSLGSSSRVAVVGHNGAGKSTLARLLAGLRKPTKGYLTSKFSSVSMTTQKPGLGFITSNVLDELRYGTSLSVADAEKILVAYDLAKFAGVSPFTLSGGEQRRFSLAIALATNPDLIIMDEPTAGMDTRQVEFVQKIMEGFNGASVYITHDPRLVGTFLKEVIVLDRGRLAYHGPTAEMTKDIFELLGYGYTNATIAFALRYLSTGLPMVPSQIEVQNEPGI